MADKLIYRVNDLPPFGTLLLLSLQQIMLMFTAATLPAILVREIGGSVETASEMVAITMIAAGVGSIIQASRNKWIGSGYLCPNICGPSYLSVSLQAAWMGGFPLMRGMIIFAGVIEMLIAPIVKHIRFLFPPLIVGLVVAFVGINVISLSIGSLFGQVYLYDSLQWQDITVGGISLLTMFLCNIFGKGFLKLYCLLIGIAAGWALALLVIPETVQALSEIESKDFFNIPTIPEGIFNITFSFELLLPFFIIAVCGSLKSLGNLLAAQKISEPEKTEIDMKPISKGLLADGVTTAMAGIMGGMAVDTSSSNIGLAAATQAVSRWIAITSGIIFALLGFFPKIATVIALVPRPVIGASLIFAVSLMISGGFKEMFSEPLDQRKSFVLGTSIIFGLSTEFMPTLYSEMPESVQPLFSSPLATTTVFAIILYQLFHLDRFFKKPEK